MPLSTRLLFVFGISAFSLSSSGCGRTPPSAPAAADSAPAATVPAQGIAIAAPESPPRMEIPSIVLSRAQGKASRSNAGSASPLGRSEHRQKLLEAMMPLQVMLGKWHGTTQREVGQFKAVDHPDWVWDFQTDPDQPALVMRSEESPYIRTARLTYLIDRALFQMLVKDADANQRTLEGNFSEQSEEFQGDDQQMHVRYKLELTQVEPAGQRDQWQIVFHQQDNNRYLQEMGKKRGNAFLRFDTVATQREGTSFAKSDAGYGEKECIISGGLGTIQVSYRGKGYWVCCTGCKAAFDEDPASWIAEFEKKKGAKKS